MSTSAADVKESIAGYYYQFLLAAQELVNLYFEEKNGAVAVEKGADIRVFNNEELFVESKFYGKEKFTIKDQAITRTIYNFAVQYNEKKLHGEIPDSLKFEFRTNIEIEGMTFFRGWHKEDVDREGVIQYIQYCLIKESQVVNTTSYDKIAELITSGEIEKNIDAKAFLTEDEIISYIKRFHFNTPPIKEEKDESAKRIENDIIGKLKEKSQIDKITSEKVKNIIVEKFFKTTFLKVDDLIYTSFVKDVVENDQKYKLEYMDKSQVENDIEVIEEVIDGYQDHLARVRIPDSESNQIIRDLRDNLAYLIEGNYEGSINSKKSDYLLTKTDFSMSKVVNVLQAFSEFVVKTKMQYGVTKITNLKGFNNLGLTKHTEQFLVKAGTNDNVNKNVEAMFKRFVGELDDNNSIHKLDDTDAVYFYNNIMEGTKPCEFNKSLLTDIIYDITDPNPEIFQAMILAQEYRCTSCIEYNNQCCHYSNSLERKTN